jgi:outer membrane biosynthesis protein TonB
VGKFRLEKKGREAQADIEKGFQEYKQDIAVFEDHKDAVTSAKAIATLYQSDVQIIVWEKKDGKWVNHLEVEGKADHDMHDQPKPKEPKAKIEKPAKLKVVKPSKKAKSEKKIEEKGEASEKFKGL